MRRLNLLVLLVLVLYRGFKHHLRSADLRGIFLLQHLQRTQSSVPRQRTLMLLELDLPILQEHLRLKSKTCQEVRVVSLMQMQTTLAKNLGFL
jgi:hypothetical protein